MSAVSDKNASDRDDLDYNLTFPPAVFGGDVEPVVFLLGWIGSKDKTLAKYSLIYEEEGCITIRYTHPVQSTFLSDPLESASHEAASEKLLQLLEDYDLLDNPVFVHVFSNGGFFVYQFFALELEKRNIKVAGAIFDSCPSDPPWNKTMQVLYVSTPSKLVFFFTAVYLSVLYLCTYIKHLFGYKVSSVYEKMRQSTSQHWPHLYLYSSADLLVPVKHVENMAEARQKAGVSIVKRHNFGSSPHVLHFKKFPDEYQKICVDFVRGCLSFEDKTADTRL